MMQLMGRALSNNNTLHKALFVASKGNSKFLQKPYHDDVNKIVICLQAGAYFLSWLRPRPH